MTRFIWQVRTGYKRDKPENIYNIFNIVSATFETAIDKATRQLGEDEFIIDVARKDSVLA